MYDINRGQNMKKIFRINPAFAGAVVCISSIYSAARVLPADAGVINVKTGYGAVADGVRDDTPALQSALSENINNSRIIYLPSGTYRVTDRIEWKNLSGEPGKHLTLMGESRQSTIIRLDDMCPGYGDTAAPRAVIMTTANSPNPQYNAFENSVFDLTVDVGTGNPGAIGIEFLASGQGSIENVTIRSQDRKGMSGISFSRSTSDSYGGGPGPCLTKNVLIRGFDYGIDLDRWDFGLCVTEITVENQNIAGIRNDRNVIHVQNLVSSNTVPAYKTFGLSCGWLTCIGAMLERGDTADYGIAAENDFYVRNLNAENSDYKGWIRYRTRDFDDGKHEYLSTPIRYLYTPSEFTHLHLPIQQFPSTGDPSLDQWESVAAHGAVPDDSSDDTSPIQQAMDAGKPVVYFPSGTYELSSTISIGPSVQKIIGCGVRLVPASGNSFDSAGTVPAFDISASAGGPLYWENFVFGNNSDNTAPGLWFSHSSDRTLVLEHICQLGGTTFYRSAGAAGDVFADDIFASFWRFSGPQNIWARQISAHRDGVRIVNDGARLWMLGFYTRGKGTMIETKNSGETELLGACHFINADNTFETAYRLNGAEAEHSLTFCTRGSTDGQSGGNYILWVEENRGSDLDGYYEQFLGCGNIVICGLYGGRVTPGNSVHYSPARFAPQTGTAYTRLVRFNPHIRAIVVPHQVLRAGFFSLRGEKLWEYTATENRRPHRRIRVPFSGHPVIMMKAEYHR
ncbi:MAG: hypothetical protein GF350_07445 [Chitinivibrionales bacterium]|nr:hypothetical protein [Chitinivibrionales bacterium]